MIEPIAKPETEPNALPPHAQQALMELDQEAAEGMPDEQMGTAGEGAPQQELESWRPAVRWALDLVKELTPGWKWTPTAERLFLGGGTDLMDQWFPGGIANMDRWGAWAKLLAGLGVFGIANFKQLKLMVIEAKKRGREADGGVRADAKWQDPEHPASVDDRSTVTRIRPEG